MKVTDGGMKGRRLMKTTGLIFFIYFTRGNEGTGKGGAVKRLLVFGGLWGGTLVELVLNPGVELMGGVSLFYFSVFRQILFFGTFLIQTPPLCTTAG